MPEISSFVESYKYLKVGTGGGRGVYRKLRERQALHDRLYWVDMTGGDNKTDLLHLDPTHFTSPFLMPTAMDMVEWPVDRIAMDEFVIKQEPMLKGPKGVETKKAGEQANQVENWCHALMQLTLAQRVRNFTKSIAKYGEGYVKMVLDTDIITKKDAYKGNPFSFVIPNSKMVYASLDMDALNRPIEIYEEKVITARMARKLAKEQNKGKDVSILPDVKDHEYVIWVEGWTDHDRLLFAIDQQYEHYDAIPVTEELIARNYYGFTPYIRAFSGRGEESASGDPADMAVGILTGRERMIIGEGRDRTILDTMLAQHALPISVREWNPGESPPKEDDFSLKPGTVVDAVNFKFHIEQPPNVPPALISQLQDIKEAKEAFQPGSVSGQIGGSNEPAVGRNLLISQANLRNTPIYISVTQGLSNVVGTVLQTVDKVLETSVEMRGYALKPQDINGNYKVYIQIRSNNISERMQKLLVLKDTWGILEHEYALEELGDINDPKAHLAKKAAQEAWDEFKRTPAGQQLVWQKVFKDIEDEEALEFIRASQTLPAAPTPGQTPSTGPEGPQGIGGSPTRGVAPMVSMEAPNAGQ